ncbi:37S ribosomal protein S9, mitochondrial [Cyphellophora attinorum]|uniref:Small ribosomal subunit protein uS9m n=1 Tax=Cyphellophora attinorum TaxID=1664694 RepID=A0A0N1P1N8_9EURO|nr:37S ribosomal protein S9, mitochondrial [Phialophora attinorum]KPI42507.1 37S ribosomal protein S9, mitochondrial [Phialophora attinorum]
MTRKAVTSILQTAGWTCKQCSLRARPSNSPRLGRTHAQSRALSATTYRRAEIATDATLQQTPFEVVAAPPIEFDKKNTVGEAARLVPASPSYFTTSPVFNDVLLRLTQLYEKHGKLPTVSAEKAPAIAFLNLMQFRGNMSEKIGAAKYSKVIALLKRLNLINPKFRPAEVRMVLEEFRRPGTEAVEGPRPKTIDEFGRSKGVGRRKSAVARVQLIEGDGQIIVNGKPLTAAFPRLHDRESVIWPLKITDRMEKYNAFVVASGGGSTGQAESITLGMANALIVHEPALKPILRMAGCVTRVMKRVERKKTGRVKARKRPAWVKR